jgi:hypothetical protein
MLRIGVLLASDPRACVRSKGKRTIAKKREREARDRPEQGVFVATARIGKYPTVTTMA